MACETVLGGGEFHSSLAALNQMLGIDDRVAGLAVAVKTVDLVSFVSDMAGLACSVVDFLCDSGSVLCDCHRWHEAHPQPGNQYFAN